MRNISLNIFIIFIISICFSCKSKLRYNKGVYVGETENDLPSGYGEWTANNKSYIGYWQLGKKNGQGIYKYNNYTYTGAFKNDYFNGYGQLLYKDSLIYEGQWKNGKREGKGISTDSLCRKIIGTWNSDFLISGIRTDSDGVYKGRLNGKGLASGHGTYLSCDGDFYEGHWIADRRNDFGFAVSKDHEIRVGEWKQDKYCGERVTYTSERIYGIDISRYQHDVGKRKYPIYWDRIRITNLGTISNKKVKGSVNYPISFVYIKSTEGIRLKNRYYNSDYRNAKKNGIHCGSYHFFSTFTSAVVQANFFLLHSHLQKNDLPPVLDVEPLPSQIKKMGGTSVLFNRIRTWLGIVHKKTGVRPILYISQSFVNRYLNLAPDIKSNYKIWIARYGEYKPDVRLIYWQLCPDGRVSGIHTKVDINVFNGYKDKFEEFLKTDMIK
jgi:lysozyme